MFVAALSFCGTAWGQTPSANLELAFAISGSTNVWGLPERLLGSWGTEVTQTQSPILSITAINRGPSPSFGVEATVAYQNPAPGTILVMIDPSCSGSSGADVAGLRVVRVQLGDLAVGESRACRVNLRATALTPRGGTTVVVRLASPTTPDPSSGDNSESFELGYWADDVEQDISLTVSGVPGLLPPGSAANVDFVLANHGPESEPGTFRQIVVSEDFLYGDLSGNQWTLVSTGDPDCIFSIADLGGPNGGTRSVQLSFLPVAAGTSRVCTLAVGAFAGARGSLRVRFTALNNAPGSLDSNLANNSSDFLLQFSILGVPAMSPVGTVVLVGAVVSLVFLRIRREIAKNS